VVSLLIDTDCGIDDAAALWWACLQPDIELVGITTVFGNVERDVAAANACRVLELAGRADVPVTLGAAEPFGPVPELRRADFIHGADGVGNTGRRPASAAPTSETSLDLLTRAVRDQPGDVVVVTIGPMTNVADLVAAEPDWAPLVKRLVVMGGAVTAPGNAMPVGEANIAHDPTAAAVALGAAWAEPPLIVGLDVTQQATLTLADIDLALQGRTAAAADLAELLAFYQPFGGTFCAPGEFPCHDALAVMAAVIAGLVSGPVLPTAIQSSPGPALGMTVFDRRQPYFAAAGQGQALPHGFAPCQAAVDVDVARFRAEFRRLLGGEAT
jgi:purine nucleosidase